MTNKEIEDYINNYRVYPDEYKGKKDKRVIRSMNAYFRVDTKNNMIIRREGRINSNGDFELAGLYKFPIGKPEEKIEITDESERTTALYSKFLLTTYNDMMKELNHEAGVIGPGKNEDWNLRDMVSEVEYLRSTYYDKNHPRSQLRETDPIHFKRHTYRLRTFLRKHRDDIDGLEVTVKHNSKYD